MKITTFNPAIITKEAAPIIKLFEELGFEQTHNKAENDDVEFSAHRMKDASGFHVDVVEVPVIPQTYTAIRINVDNYEEAYEFFMSKGFRQARGFAPSTTASSKYAYLVSPSGYIIDLCQHVKKSLSEDQLTEATGAGANYCSIHSNDSPRKKDIDDNYC